MKFAILIFLTISFLSLLACQRGNSTLPNPAPDQTPKADASPEPDLYDDSSLSAIEYEALLPIIGKGGIIVVRDRTATDFLDKTLNAQVFSGIQQEMVDDYNRKNEAPDAIECKFSPEYRCTVLTDDMVKAMSDFTKENATEKWKNFREKYGTNRYYTVSRVGFSPDGQQAIAFASFSCGTLCAEGTYYLLVKEDGRWRVSEEKNVWVS